MNCPHCGVPLQLSERQGVEIDYCPGCRGVWLDRGELDKIIDRSVSQRAPPAPAPAPQYDRYDDRRPPAHGHQQGYGKKRKRESWLSELFD